MIHRALRFFVDILFPSICPGCKADYNSVTTSWGLCSECIARLHAQPLVTCSVCRNTRPLFEFGDQTNRCHRQNGTDIISILPYADEIVSRLVHEFKFKKRAFLARPLGTLLARSLKDNGVDLRGFVVTSIPLSREHLRKRGFNQSELLARVAARELKLPYEPLLVRAKQAETQSSLTSWQQRRINIADAFAHAPRRQSKGRSILLIDDVYTSGATLSEAVSVLRHAGAAVVCSAVVARAGRN